MHVLCFFSLADKRRSAAKGSCPVLLRPFCVQAGLGSEINMKDSAQSAAMFGIKTAT